MSGRTGSLLAAMTARDGGRAVSWAMAPLAGSGRAVVLTAGGAGAGGADPDAQLGTVPASGHRGAEPLADGTTVLLRLLTQPSLAALPDCGARRDVDAPPTTETADRTSSTGSGVTDDHTAGRDTAGRDTAGRDTAGRDAGGGAVDGAAVPSADAVRVRPTALPLPDRAVDGLAVLLVLPTLDRLDQVFAEFRRVLRPAGTLVVVLPWAPSALQARLRRRPTVVPAHRHWRHRAVLDHTEWVLSAADFAVVEQHRMDVRLALPDPTAADVLSARLSAEGFWPPLDAVRRADAATRLRLAAVRSAEVSVPLRRWVARR